MIEFNLLADVDKPLPLKKRKVKGDVEEKSEG